MDISNIEKPGELQNKWDEIINETKCAQKKTLSVMLQLRKEISSLSQLKKHYPASVQIDERINQYDQLIEQSTEMLDDLKKKLSEFTSQKEALEQTLESCAELIKSPSNVKP